MGHELRNQNSLDLLIEIIAATKKTCSYAIQIILVSLTTAYMAANQIQTMQMT